MGWDDYHAHYFKFGSVYYGSSELVESDPDTRDEDDFTLGSLLKRRGQTLEFEYDFGDGWEHQVRLEKVLPAEDDRPAPICLAGARACPPEDCGGIYGYYDLLEKLETAKKDGSKLDEQYRWLKNYDPEAFDPAAVNQKLRKIFKQG
jgi:hypothetical protein